MRDLVFAIALHKMPGEILDKLLPLVPILRWRNVRFVPKRMRRDGIRGQLARHEAQLDKWARVVFEQAVVNLVHVRKIEDRLTAGVLVVET